jgi:pimeloyl-ACP methyl ester carboxylesterase
MSLAPDHLVTLASGRQIALDECGDPHGHPVFFFHGWPASRLQGAGFSVEAREFGLRILSPDRPGIGLSTSQPGRRLLDWPAVMRELAEHFGFSRFSVLGMSGGAPYTLATAYALPEFVDVAVVISGAPPLGPETDRRALLPVYRWLLTAYQLLPTVLRSGFHVIRPFAYTRPPRWTWPIILRLAPPGDRGAISDPDVFSGCLDCQREAWRVSGRGVYEDAEIYPRDWGFAPEDIRVPVRLWHGKGDSSFSWKLAEALAQRIPDCEARFVEGEGHYSLPIRLRREIIEDLVAARELARSGV